MPSQLEQIRDQQRETWDKFSSGWKKWDELVLNWLAPVGQELIRSAALEDDFERSRRRGRHRRAGTHCRHSRAEGDGHCHGSF